ncbi:H2-forming methylenetetrahydromethanopterin dehydrogenase [Methanocorpusculum labreanum Z]|uniref:5,10-methenyltetrahydromethanopterin hydrogenase n=1 Tax=Methanocorpusculum labreanum (strain ATCC 43576 / DSM 4855 / Z) TaxID=410358 RepID=A2SU99_METLZ|nr:5,10-methenyltetrahydromethanopterin hydrogenase [Methanocorpusculum labreanum]ABN07905.1 H2-forming methylenetetrahydromethanopterin dehydrogenase [Methanocorpusculum labreanum Z]
MKVAILGAGCYRTHAAAGITNFARACEVAKLANKPEIAMTHSTGIMAAELKYLAGINDIVIADPVFDNQFTVIDDFAYEDVIKAHETNPESIMPAIRAKVKEVAKDLPKPPKGAIHFTHPETLGIKVTTDDREAVSDADLIITWLPKGDMQKGIIEKFAGDIKEGAIITHACTIPTTKFYNIFNELGLVENKKVNVTSYHPGAVPEMKGQVFISEGYAAEPAIQKLVDLGHKARGTAYKLPAELLGPVCDMCAALTAVTYAGLLTYRESVMNVLGAPAGFAQMMAAESLEQITALMKKTGIANMEKSLDPGVFLGTADSMNFGALSEILPTVMTALEKRKLQ